MVKEFSRNYNAEKEDGIISRKNLDELLVSGGRRGM